MRTRSWVGYRSLLVVTFGNSSPRAGPVISRASAIAASSASESTLTHFRTLAVP